MKRFGTLALVVLLCIAVVGCAKESAPVAAPSSAARVTAADAGGSVDIAVGGLLTIALPANPSTGYGWVATNTPEFMFEQGQPSFEQSATSNNPGAGGTEVLRYKAVAAGTGPLHLEYKRAWETTIPPAKTFQINVNVK
jgi:inhibitor of cysteine peptidase